MVVSTANSVASNGNEDSEQTIKRQKTYSRIFDGEYYKVQREAGGNIEAECTQCLEIKRGNISSTGNFISHYKMKHKSILDDLKKYTKSESGKNSQQSTQPTLAEMFQSNSPDIVCKNQNI